MVTNTKTPTVTPSPRVMSNITPSSSVDEFGMEKMVKMEVQLKVRIMKK